MKYLRNISAKKLGLTPANFLTGWLSILIFTAIVFILVQSFSQFVSLPSWVTDKDPIFALLLAVILQELVFRGLLLTLLEPLGKKKAIWIATVIFAISHFVFPSSWLIVILSLIGGYFWGWHFLKYRNLYVLIISHLIVNLSFNYLFL